MKKSILNLGKVLHKAEQKTINGGGNFTCPHKCGNRGCDCVVYAGMECINYACKPKREF